ALWSHKPGSVCFLYTPNNPKIVEHRNLLISEKGFLPVNTVSFYPVSITGNEILKIPAAEGKKVVVNITPGTKGHGSFLALWAKLHSTDVFSIETSSQKLMKMPEGSGRSVIAPPPTLLLKLSGINVKKYGEGKGSLFKDRGLFEGMLDFLKMINKEGKDIKDFPERKISLSGASLIPLSNDKVKILHKEKGNTVSWSVKTGKWFERLIGYVLAECGAQDVQIGITTEWRSETKKHLAGKYSGASQMSEIDVAARFKAVYYIVSCKATKKKEINKI
ncbi:unnamed protein product, partial [marine sediment metagenome]